MTRRTPRFLESRRLLWLGILSLGPLHGVPGCESTPSVGEPDLVDALHPDASSQMTAAVGELIAFDLPGHAGTGYQWVQRGSTPAFLQAQGEPVFTSDDPDRMGANGTTRFLFQVLKEGKGDLQFDYLRAWEENTAPVRRSTVEVTATKSTDPGTSADSP